MNIKKNTGLTAVDLVVAIVAIIIFSTLIFSIMRYNVLENLKLTKETMATIHLTEIFENIGIANYDEVTEENINSFVNENIKSNYNVQFEISEVSQLFEGDSAKENIIKKVTASLSYQVGGRDYIQTMSRIKIKE